MFVFVFGRISISTSLACTELKVIGLKFSQTVSESVDFLRIGPITPIFNTSGMTLSLNMVLYKLICSLQKVSERAYSICSVVTPSMPGAQLRLSLRMLLAMAVCDIPHSIFISRCHRYLSTTSEFISACSELRSQSFVIMFSKCWASTLISILKLDDFLLGFNRFRMVRPLANITFILLNRTLSVLQRRR